MNQLDQANQPTILDSSLELFFGEANDALCRVYARLDRDFSTADLQLSGTIRGPHCQYAQTLPTNFALVDRGPAGAALAESIVTDPCFWTPEMPFLYDAVVELRRRDQVVERAQRTFGIRRLGAQDKNLIFERKRWVLRGIIADEAPPADLADYHEAFAAMVVKSPSDALCRRASQTGVLLAGEVSGSGDAIAEQLRRLARWPAVGIAILNKPPISDQALRGIAPNVLLAERFGPIESLVPAAWAQVVICEVGNVPEMAARISGCLLPIVAWRPGGARASVAEARTLCDRLQRDLAHVGQFAGYVV